MDRIADARVNVDAPDIADQVARRSGEVLAFPLVVVHPDGVAVGAVKFGIDTDHGLDEIVPGRISRRLWTGDPRSVPSIAAGCPGVRRTMSRPKKGTPVSPLCSRGSAATRLPLAPRSWSRCAK